VVNLPEVLRDNLPDEMLFADLRTVLEERGWQVKREARYELEEREIDIPRGVGLETVARGVNLYEYSHRFGNHHVAVLAIGGVRSAANGIVEAGHCFAILWYSDACKLITVTFSEIMP